MTEFTVHTARGYNRRTPLEKDRRLMSVNRGRLYDLVGAGGYGRGRVVLGKGWKVCRLGHSRWQGNIVMKDGTRVWLCDKSERWDCISCSIAGAFNAGVLDWFATLQWLKLEGYWNNASYSLINTPVPVPVAHRAGVGKGWYIERHKYKKVGGVMGYSFHIWFGQHSCDKVWSSSRATLRGAVLYCLRSGAGGRNEWYDRDLSIRWLVKKGLESLIGEA